MGRGLEPWHWECPKCGYESAELEPAINKMIAHAQIDELFREKGLRSLRIANFNKLLKAIESNGRKSGSLLDVGSAHGWFMEAAKKRGFQIFGIEPDSTLYNKTCQRGFSVRQGFFPEILTANEQFDVIVFNDVFEHIPDVKAVLAGCRAHLRPGAMLVLNLPSSTGMLYKVARLLSRLGVNSFFERLWQKGLPSPHLHYFSSTNLHTLLQENGFQVVAAGRLSTLSLNGLFTRISYAGKYPLPVRLLVFLALALALPILAFMPKDIIYALSINQAKHDGT
jgi:2-polyprenyl-3-methyl-5-hydroxy-6-metoxy-1,4-benzoquinol methylase